MYSSMILCRKVTRGRATQKRGRGGIGNEEEETVGCEVDKGAHVVESWGGGWGKVEGKGRGFNQKDRVYRAREKLRKM